LKKLQHKNKATKTKNQMVIQIITKLRGKHEELEIKVKEKRRIVTIATLWKVVKKTQKGMKNQITKYYDQFNMIQLIRDV